MTSGTNNRQRQNALRIRVTDEERATLQAAADRAGLALGGYARSVLLDAEPPRQSRRPPVERAELARLLAQVGKVGSNVNQIAHALNAGGEVAQSELVTALHDVAEMRAAIMQTLGRSG